ncbi:MAG: glutaminyl-peptide cyclotransferase [Bacteroidetes bacterium]|nr:MAG: glutaminyl-peptide cyclotransferase [Bacteroidota bacterium]
MNKSLRIIIIALILICGIAFLVVPLLRQPEPVESPKTKDASTFVSNTNLSALHGEEVSLELALASGFSKIDLFLEDSLLNSWQGTTGKVNWPLDTKKMPLGFRTLSLVSYDASGNELIETRILRILSDIEPKHQTASVKQAYLHNPTSFTQGLEFHGGKLYESTGQNGKSFIAEVESQTGVIRRKVNLDRQYFGEGITILNGEIFQLTWQQGACFVYDLEAFEIKKQFSYTGEGWGICNDGKQLIMSNGSDQIQFRDPGNFSVTKTITVCDRLGTKTKLNELEYIQGMIYANVWMSDFILVIDPTNGKVQAEIDCSEIARAGRDQGEVLNGIAYDQSSGKIYLTGKNWSKLLEVEIN